MMMSDNDIASTFKATIHIIFVFCQMIVLIIRILPISQDPLLGTVLVIHTTQEQNEPYLPLPSKPKLVLIY